MEFQLEPSLKIQSKNILICSDWHLPLVNKNCFNALIKAKDEYKVKDLAVVGDFWDCENYSFFVNYQLQKTFQDEVKFVGETLRFLTKEFKNLWFCCGNHERRWLRWNEGKMTIKQMFNITGVTEGYITTPYDHIILNDSWRLCHSKHYSRTPLSLARKLATIYTMNIINAHGHFTAGPAKDDSNRFWIIDIGGLFDKEKIEYLRATTTYPQLNNGFALVQDNEPKMVFYDIDK